ncbi:MAG: hypothetical protein WCJ42_02780 [Actinomycetes bacterium]
MTRSLRASLREVVVESSPQGPPPAKGSFSEFLALRHIEPEFVRWALVGAVWGGVVGGIVGLIVGLFVYVPTAVFAMFEIGIPGALVGGALGFLLYSLTKAGRRR